MNNYKISPLNKQKVYQFLKATGSTFLLKCRILKGINVWDIFIVIGKKKYETNLGYTDITQELKQRDIEAIYIDTFLKSSLGDCFLAKNPNGTIDWQYLTPFYKYYNQRKCFNSQMNVPFFK